MREYVYEFATTMLPILLGLGVALANRLWLKYKTTRFKLTEHPMFLDLLVSKRNIHNWVCADNRHVFIDALSIKFDCWRVEGKKLAQKLQKGNYSDKQLSNIITEWAFSVIEMYTDRWKEVGIPDEVIDRITAVHEEKVEQLFEEIVKITQDNDMYPFKMQKAIAVFGILRVLLADTKNDFNRLVYREFYNGDFTGVVYKGLPISDVAYKKYKEGMINKSSK